MRITSFLLLTALGTASIQGWDASGQRNAAHDSRRGVKSETLSTPKTPKQRLAYYYANLLADSVGCSDFGPLSWEIGKELAGIMSEGGLDINLFSAYLDGALGEKMPGVNSEIRFKVIKKETQDWAFVFLKEVEARYKPASKTYAWAIVKQLQNHRQYRLDSKLAIFAREIVSHVENIMAAQSSQVGFKIPCGNSLRVSDVDRLRGKIGSDPSARALAKAPTPAPDVTPLMNAQGRLAVAQGPEGPRPIQDLSPRLPVPDPEKDIAVEHSNTWIARYRAEQKGEPVAQLPPSTSKLPDFAIKTSELGPIVVHGAGVGPKDPPIVFIPKKVDPTPTPTPAPRTRAGIAASRGTEKPARWPSLPYTEPPLPKWESKHPASNTPAPVILPTVPNDPNETGGETVAAVDIDLHSMADKISAKVKDPDARKSLVRPRSWPTKDGPEIWSRVDRCIPGWRKRTSFAEQMAFFAIEHTKRKSGRIATESNLDSTMVPKAQRAAFDYLSHPLCTITKDSLNKVIMNDVDDSLAAALNRFVVEYNARQAAAKKNPGALNDFLKLKSGLSICLGAFESISNADVKSYHAAKGKVQYGPKTRGHMDKMARRLGLANAGEADAGSFLPEGVLVDLDEGPTNARKKDKDKESADAWAIGIHSYEEDEMGRCVGNWNAMYPDCALPDKPSADERLALASSPFQSFNAFCGENAMAKSEYRQVNAKDSENVFPSTQNFNGDKLKAPADRCVSYFGGDRLGMRFGPFRRSVVKNGVGNLEEVVGCAMNARDI